MDDELIYVVLGLLGLYALSQQSSSSTDTSNSPTNNNTSTSSAPSATSTSNAGNDPIVFGGYGDPNVQQGSDLTNGIGDGPRAD